MNTHVDTQKKYHSYISKEMGGRGVEIRYNNKGNGLNDGQNERETRKDPDRAWCRNEP